REPSARARRGTACCRCARRRTSRVLANLEARDYPVFALGVNGDLCRIPTRFGLHLRLLEGIARRLLGGPIPVVAAHGRLLQHLGGRRRGQRGALGSLLLALALPQPTQRDLYRRAP